ncbi:fibronectin type III domain-containing protein [Dyadobacter arcticus]|uniref:Fibronectin type-III domain-containing protein n=1 Tax=Dyadobacter arcticus TaxID=1078754 RepID=A0ABX0UER7_9BACT|nr:fibronectin type III domain-containing protein [Dyadobacter arcticus]NIJ51157.1 hypothetical protein [Dyadobacter arcticus]
MKKFLTFSASILLSGLLVSCSIFSAVDPLAPAVSQLEVVSVKRTEITVSGTINKPDFKNTRQEKKSGLIREYGLVYGTNQNLTVEVGPVKVLGISGTLPLTIQNETISGLLANTQYYVAAYARNEGGGIALSEIVSVKTTDQPGIFTSKVSVKVAITGASPYDLDEAKVVASGDAQTDVTMETFTISGRGTVLSVSSVGGTVLKNLGVVDFNALTYLNLLNIRDYKTEAISILMNTSTANTVIAFKTKEGRYGKWKIESLVGKDLTVSLIAYDK